MSCCRLSDVLKVKNNCLKSPNTINMLHTNTKIKELLSENDLTSYSSCACPPSAGAL